MKLFPLPLFALACLAATLTTRSPADERTLTPEQMERLANEGDLSTEVETRPASLPDLTQYEPLPDGGKKGPPPIWHLGPTGIVGQMIDYQFKGDQILVKGTLKGSPAEGKILPGDVLLGLNGEKFEAGGHLGILIGKAIIDAELAENKGRISFQVWRDKNYAARSGRKDVAAVDVEKLFTEALDDNSLYDWKPEEKRKQEVRQMRFDEHPIEATTLEVDLMLRVLPPYSDTAPYDCPKTNQILEDAWKVLEKRFVADPQKPKSGRGGILEAIALVASGKPEHRELVKKWVRSPHGKMWHPPTTRPGAMFEPGYKGYKGFQSWHHGFIGLNCAIYYDATGDEFVLPALRKYAIDTAMGQSWAGSWGHTFAYPSFNGGKLHMMNPGYGALNAAGNRCFFLITLAQKLGIEHPEIDQAVKRAHRFFGSYVDQGCIPYGDHPAYASDDSNGKNTGVAFSMKLLGDKHGAKYFAMMSSHCAFTRRGGHGHDYHGNWSSWAAGLCGPEVRAYNERNLRWRRTLSRMFDGSFVYHGSYGALRDPTATQVLHQAVHLKQTIITGKDPDKDLYPSEREMNQLLTSATTQFNDPWLIKKAGTPWRERPTGEILDLLDIFYPKARASFARELGKRYQAGEKEILPKLLALLESDAPRFRDGALHALQACGSDAVLESLSKVTPLLGDPWDFVRITAVRVISKATEAEPTQLAMLEATLDDPKSVAPNSVRNATGDALFGKDNRLANNPFDAGFDEEVVRQALEDILLTDPGGTRFLGSRRGAWEKDTVVRIAGPLVHIAEEEQIGDQMFANRSAPAQNLLGKFGYREALEATAHRLRKQAAIPRHIRPFVGFKRALMNPVVVRENPAAFRDFLPHLATVLIDNPLQTDEVVIGNDKVKIPLTEMAGLIMAEEKPTNMPSIADDVRALFQKKLDEIGGTGAKIKLCRSVLAHPGYPNFRKMAAMEALAGMLGPDALADLVPYLGHAYWRLHDHSQALAARLVGEGGTDTLVKIFPKTSPSNPQAAAGILELFARCKAQEGLPLAQEGLKHEDPALRQAALRTLAALRGVDALDAILAHLKAAEAPEDLRGCEDALLHLALIDGSKDAATVRDALIALLPGIDGERRAAVYYLLAVLADEKSFATLRQAGDTDSISEFKDIVSALSYSPSRQADQVLLELARADKASAKVVGAQSVRRMVLGPDGFGDLSDTERMDFAEPMLKLDMNGRLISYLSRVHHPRALRALMFCLKNGVSHAAESLVTNAEGLDDDLPTADAKVAAESLQDVIEYIEVTYLRGGAQGKDWRVYPKWKALQARAGKALLKVHKPGKTPIPTFDPLDLDP